MIYQYRWSLFMFWKRWRVCSWRCLIWDVISITLLLLEPHPFWLYQHYVSYRREVYPAFDAELAKYHLTEMANSSSRRCLGTSGWLITTYLFLWGFYFNQFWLTVWKNTQIINKQMSKKSTGTEGSYFGCIHWVIRKIYWRMIQGSDSTVFWNFKKNITQLMIELYHFLFVCIM